MLFWFSNWPFESRKPLGQRLDARRHQACAVSRASISNHPELVIIRFKSTDDQEFVPAPSQLLADNHEAVRLGRQSTSSCLIFSFNRYLGMVTVSPVSNSEWKENWTAPRLPTRTRKYPSTISNFKARGISIYKLTQSNRERWRGDGTVCTQPAISFHSLMR